MILELRVVDSTVALSASLNIVGVDARSPGSRVATLIGLLATVVVDVLEIESVDVARDISEDGQANVDKQIWGGVLAKTLRVTTVMVRPKLPTYPFHILKQSIHRQGGLKPCQNLNYTYCSPRRRLLTEDGDENDDDGRCGAHGDCFDVSFDVTCGVVGWSA